MAKKPYIWDGSNWVELSIGMPQLVYSYASPTGPYVGQIWIDTAANSSALDPLEFLTIGSASATYLPISASSDYLFISVASATYLPISASATLGGGGYSKSFLLGGM